MNSKRIIQIILISASVAIVTVIVLKYLGHENPVVAGGAIAGGVSGGIIGGITKKKKEQ